MIVERDETTDKLIYKDEKKVWTFEDIRGGLAFGDQSTTQKNHDSLCVCGRREDGVIVLLYGFSGDWGNFTSQLVMAKDLFLAQWWEVPASPDKAVDELRKLGGLTHYKTERDQFSSRRILRDPNKRWPHFRDKDHVAYLCEIEEELQEKKGFEAAVAILRQDIRAQRVQFACTWRQLTQRVMQGQWGKEKLRDSALHALVYASQSVRPRSGMGPVEIAVVDRN